jgi:hypothetical protein
LGQCPTYLRPCYLGENMGLFPWPCPKIKKLITIIFADIIAKLLYFVEKSND